jgi:hypothetical protein
VGAPFSIPAAVDLLSRATDHVRPHLDRSNPLGERLRAFWAGVVAARDLGASDVAEEEFFQLAEETGLVIPEPITNAKIFKERCEARAILFAIGEYDLHEAVDVLQATAEASGLVDEIGQDAVQALMAEAFGRVR